MGHAPFVGRKPELSALRQAIEDARAGLPRIVMVVGEAGIGKTALVSEFLKCNAAGTLVKAVGDDGETSYAFGILHQLAADGLAAGAPGLSQALAKGSVSDPMAAGWHLLQLWGELQSHGPVVLYIEDSHWADHPSLQAVVFAFRRLRADQLLLLVSARESEQWRLPEGLHRVVGSERGTTIRLGGLETADIQTLAKSTWQQDVSVKAAQRLRDHTGGNPLHALTLFEELSPEMLGPDQVLPAPRFFKDTILARLHATSERTQSFVRAASVLGQRSLVAQVAELAGDFGAVHGQGGHSNVVGSLAEAVEAGILQIIDTGAGSVVSFAHPLIRTAVYEGIGPVLRSDLHQRAAGLVARSAALYHRASATQGVDSELAKEFLQLAAEDAALGALAPAAGHLLVGRRLVPPGPAQERILLDAVDLLLGAGQVREAAEFAPQIDQMPDSARRLYVMGHMAILSGQPRKAEHLLSRAWEAHHPQEDTDVAGRIAANLAQLMILGGRHDEAAAWGSRANQAGSLPPGLKGLATASILIGLFGAGKCEEAATLLRALPEDPNQIPEDRFDELGARGMTRLWADDVSGARADLQAIFQRTPASLYPHRLAILGYLAEADFRLGNWDEAIGLAELLASLAHDADQVWLVPFLRSEMAFVLAGRGDWESAETVVDMAVQAADQIPTEASLLYARTAAAWLARAKGRPSDLVEAVQPMVHFRHGGGTYEPGVLPWRELYVEALVSLGRLEEAEEALRPFESVASERGRRSSMANAARARGKLESAKGHDDLAGDAFRQGLMYGESLLGPLDMGLLELSFGQFLRRRGSRRQAAAKLQSAQQRFEALGAKPYLEECQRELEGCGLRPRPRIDRDRRQLTPQELAVARLAASGLSNREVAADLFVSVKTVEYHLGNIFSKLGFKSRTQLAARFPLQP